MAEGPGLGPGVLRCPAGKRGAGLPRALSTHTHLGQVAAVGGAHGGQSLLLLEVVLSPPLSILFLPPGFLLLWRTHPHNREGLARAAHSGRLPQPAPGLELSRSSRPWSGLVLLQGSCKAQETQPVAVVTGQCQGNLRKRQGRDPGISLDLWSATWGAGGGGAPRLTASRFWRSRSFSARILCCSALSALRFSCSQRSPSALPGPPWPLWA